VSHHLSKIAFEAEKHLIPLSQWRQHLPKMPEEGRAILRMEMDGPSGPTGLAKHPEHGYMILGSGQGPFIIWSEKELPE